MTSEFEDCYFENLLMCGWISRIFGVQALRCLSTFVDLNCHDITECALLLSADEAPLAKLPDHTKHALSRIKLVFKDNP